MAADGFLWLGKEVTDLQTAAFGLTDVQTREAFVPAVAFPAMARKTYN